MKHLLLFYLLFSLVACGQSDEEVIAGRQAFAKAQALAEKGQFAQANEALALFKGRYDSVTALQSDLRSVLDAELLTKHARGLGDAGVAELEKGGSKPWFLKLQSSVSWAKGPLLAKYKVVRVDLQAEEVNSLTAKIERMKQGLSNPEGLVAAFEANEVNATERLKGKTVLLTGTIEKIGLDVLNNPYIVLGPTSGFRKVQCQFADKAAVASLNKGQQVTLRGECRGLMMNVLFKDCAIEEGLETLRARLKAMPKPGSKKASKSVGYF